MPLGHRMRVGCAGLALLGAVLGAGVPAARAQIPPADSSLARAEAPSRALTLERVEFTGLTRTPAALATRATGLSLPAAASPEVVQAASERLRASGLFRSVAVHTRAGERPGAVVLVCEVQESRPHLRFGLGHEDFSGWYLIPVQLNADNLTGHGEGLRLSSRVGYRMGGLDLTLRRPALASATDFWEVRLRGEGVDRVYFLDSTETKHHIERGGIQFRLGRRLSRSLALEGWLGADRTQVDSTASVYADRRSQDRSKGDEVPFASLPYEIRRDVRERPQSRLGLALVLDRRVGSGLAMHGTWARVAGEGVFSEFGDIGSWQADARGYARLGPEVQLAARVRAAAVSGAAPFYERFYVGGLYTVRGYPSQSLSPPQGDLNLGAASLELRHAWWGPASDPRVTGIAFVDAATGWNRDAPSARDVAWGAGLGLRVRLPWVGQLGIDAAVPLSDTPVDEAFHVNGSLGWSF